MLNTNMVKSNKKISVLGAISIVILVNGTSIEATYASNDADYSFRLTSEWRDCQDLGREYQEVYAFETDSFYINICQKENVYFYSGESKHSNSSSIFIPAEPLENNQGFQAVNGNVSYLVLLPFSQANNPVNTAVSRPGEAILTIRRNDQLVSIESSLNKYCQPAQAENSSPENRAIAFDPGELGAFPASEKITRISSQSDFGMDIFLSRPNKLLPPEIFQSDSRFDFYRVGGKIHRLTTCK